MIRLLIYLLCLILLAAAITIILGLEGHLTGRFEGQEYFVPVNGLLAIGLGAILLTVFGTWIFGWFARMPERIKRKREDGQRNRGMIALSRGLEAVAAGDADDAQRFAKQARRQLDAPNLTRLLTAQAAQLAGDNTTAAQNYTAMLEAPETEFLGLRGLYLQALAEGRNEDARDYAERAFRLRPNAQWAFQSVYQLSVERGSWGDAREALRRAVKNGLAEGEEAKRKEAVLLTARAHAAETVSDTEEAARDAAAALKLAPGFAPAAVLSARLAAASNNRAKATKILEEAWSREPHPAISTAYGELYKDSPASRRAQKLMKLSELSPNRDESKLLKAEQHLVLEEWNEARLILEPLLERHPTARTFKAMASAMRGLYGPEQAAPWLDKAANAPLEATPGAEGHFHFTTDGWRRLVSEYGDHGRLAPPPLEEVETRLSREEILLLTAPPPEPEPEIELEPEPVAEAENAEDAPIEDPQPEKDADSAGEQPLKPSGEPAGATATPSEPSAEDEKQKQDLEQQAAAIEAARLT